MYAIKKRLIVYYKPFMEIVKSIKDKVLSTWNKQKPKKNLKNAQKSKKKKKPKKNMNNPKLQKSKKIKKKSSKEISVRDHSDYKRYQKKCTL